MTEFMTGYNSQKRENVNPLLQKNGEFLGCGHPEDTDKASALRKTLTSGKTPYEDSKKNIDLTKLPDERALFFFAKTLKLLKKIKKAATLSHNSINKVTMAKQKTIFQRLEKK